MATLSARVPDPMAARFEAFAASRGGKSRVLRALMEGALATGGAGGAAQSVNRGGGSPPEGSVSAPKPHERSLKITLRLSPEEGADLDRACADAGLLRTQWIVALVRRRLSARPQFDRGSAMALLEVRRELRRIGVNLRELAESSPERGSSEAAELGRLAREVREQLEGVRWAVAGNLAYWDAGDP